MALPSPAGLTGTYTAGTSNFDASLKQIYRPSNVKKLTYEDRPLYASMPKFEGFGGRDMPIVVKWGHPQGRSKTFVTAQANASEVKVDDFRLTRTTDYSISYIEAEILEATRGDTYAFLTALSEVIDGTLETLADSIETKLFRSGTGSVAQLHATTAPTSANPMVLTLMYSDEITCFEYNMVLEAFSGDAGTTQRRATPGTTGITIAGVDRTAGTITTGFDNSGPTTDWAVSDYLACDGDVTTTTVGALDNIAGLQAWCPDSTPSSTALFSVDRTSDSRLYGMTHDASGGGKLEDHFIKAQSKNAAHGGKPSLLAMHHAQTRRLTIELGAKKVYGQVKARDKNGTIAKIGFRSIVIEGDYGPIDIVAMNKCQATKAWLLTIEDWLLASLGPCTKIIVADGLRMLRMADQDAFEIRSRFRGNLGTKSPIRNTNITLPAPA